MLRYKFKSNFARPVYLIDGLRTPWLKKSPFSATDLALQTIRALLLRQTLTPQTIEHLIVGCTQSGPKEINLGSVLASRLGCGSQTAVYTLQSHDASGFQALDNAALAISSGCCELALVGSSEVMSRAPLWIDYERFSTLSKWVHSKSSRWRTTELNFLRWQQLVTFFSSQVSQKPVRQLVRRLKR
ncbi:thiolase family protein [Rickettsiella massiliensis]|uniref:thiolase family protein n=1 Tax=Rickettsiella massiliensis TaxID=676517 RepID=UPI00029A84C4|nr:beta-ketoacyl synthase N-terminal-like domain-containing protein [Rickettsiella massiliensis]